MPGLLRDGVHRQRGDASDPGGLECPPDGVVQKGRSDALLVVVCGDSLAARRVGVPRRAAVAAVVRLCMRATESSSPR